MFAAIDPVWHKKYREEIGGDEDPNKDANLKSLVYADIVKLANANKFNSLEIPKNMVLLKDGFTLDNGMLTESQKLKRNIAKKTFIKEIDAMYKEGINKFPMKK